LAFGQELRNWESLQEMKNGNFYCVVDL
jgi:hypothetical protein